MGHVVTVCASKAARRCGIRGKHFKQKGNRRARHAVRLACHLQREEMPQAKLVTGWDVD